MIERSGVTREHLAAVVRAREKPGRRGGPVRSSAWPRPPMQPAFPLLSHDDTSSRAAAMVSLARLPVGGIPDHGRDPRKMPASEGDPHRAWRSECGAGAEATPAGSTRPRWWGAAFCSGPGFGLLLSSAAACGPSVLAARRASFRSKRPGHWCPRLPAAAVGACGSRMHRFRPPRGFDHRRRTGGPSGPRVVATIVAGRVVHLAEADRIIASR